MTEYIAKYKFKIFGVHIWIMRKETLDEAKDRIARTVQIKFLRRGVR